MTLIFITSNTFSSFESIKESLIISSNSLNYYHSVEEIDALQVTKLENRIRSIVSLNRNSNLEEHLFFYCSLNQTVEKCESSNLTFKEATYIEFIQGINLSFKAIKLLFKRNKIDVNSISEVKVWKEKASSIIAVDEMWGKFKYSLDGRERLVFTQCHRHSENEPIDCHLASQGNDEPRDIESY